MPVHRKPGGYLYEVMRVSPDATGFDVHVTQSGIGSRKHGHHRGLCQTRAEVLEGARDWFDQIFKPNQSPNPGGVNDWEAHASISGSASTTPRLTRATSPPTSTLVTFPGVPSLRTRISLGRPKNRPWRRMNSSPAGIRSCLVR